MGKWQISEYLDLDGKSRMVRGKWKIFWGEMLHLEKMGGEQSEGLVIDGEKNFVVVPPVWPHVEGGLLPQIRSNTQGSSYKIHYGSHHSHHATEQSNLNGHDKVWHIEDSWLWSDSVWQDGQNADMSGTDEEGVYMIGHDRTTNIKFTGEVTSPEAHLSNIGVELG